jgi:hypothetical protein
MDSYSITTTTSEETERDLQTTEHNELQSEVSKTVQTDMALSTGVGISSSYGPFVSANYSIDAAIGSSVVNSSSVASTFAQDIVDRSVTKVSQSVRETIVQKKLAETEETSSHGFDNQTSGHVIGVYRWLEQIWEAQVMNYGRRLIMEFMVPEPAALWREARKTNTERSLTLAPPPPLGSLTADQINETNYTGWAQRYGATNLAPPPAPLVYVSKVFDLPELEHEKRLQGRDYNVRTFSGVMDVPDGYVAVHCTADESKAKWGTGEEQLRLHVGDKVLNLVDGPRDGSLFGLTGPIHVGIFLYDFKAATVNLQLKCERTAAAFAQWQLDTHQRIVEAYERKNDAYLAELNKTESAEEVTRAEIPSDGKRQIEAAELKRGSLMLLSGQDFKRFNAISFPTEGKPPELDAAEALEEGQRVRFYEQSFEWTQLTYVFYPYFWGRHDEWFDVLDQTDSDPTFEAFLKAGSARVQVPVRPGFERVVLYYLATGRIWKGAHAPVLGDPLYVPIVEEIAESTGLSLSEKKPYGEPWTYSVPTDLVLLESDPKNAGL